MADSIRFKVEKKEFVDDAAGERGVLWLSVAHTVAKEGTPARNEGSLNTASHRSVPVSLEAFARVKKGDTLVLAVLREDKPGFPGALERL